ncbi:MAG: hypothetical protein Ct9H300mP19_03220 [Dehalococcoidia bacterium]|nr:MAG: hypothetical protein Ct9H300mP19_03220 [Dehalococcoidia bacterium]
MLDHFHVPIEDQVRVNRDDLHRTTADIFTVMGLSQEDANLAADGLVTADIRGCETHGVPICCVFIKNYTKMEISIRNQDGKSQENLQR